MYKESMLILQVRMHSIGYMRLWISFLIEHFSLLAVGKGHLEKNTVL